MEHSVANAGASNSYGGYSAEDSDLMDKLARAYEDLSAKDERIAQLEAELERERAEKEASERIEFSVHREFWAARQQR